MYKTKCLREKLVLFLKIFFPILIYQFANYSASFVDTAMTGQYNTMDLAGVSMATSIWNPFFTFLTGIVSALVPIIGHHLGRGKKDVLALLPENIENDSIKSPAQIEKVEEVPDNVTPYGEIERIPMTPMRKVIAQRMVESYLTAPTFTLNYEVDMTEMLALRKKVLEPIMEATGKKTTVTDLLSLAVVKTLMKHPYINASLTEDGKTIITHNYVNLAMAVGMDNGLMTPVVYNAEKMSLSELVVAFKDIIGRTLDGKLAPSELQNSTFTISNLGMFGVQSFGPIINQPNSAILGVSSTIEKPVVVNGEIVIRPIMSLGLTIDHRVVDGMAGAKFMKDLKELIETPISMLI